MECPCRYCIERNINCHSNCDKYKEWFEWNNNLRDSLHKQKYYESLGRHQKPKRRYGK